MFGEIKIRVKLASGKGTFYDASSKLTLVDDEIKEVNLALSIQKLIKDRVLIQIPKE